MYLKLFFPFSRLIFKAVIFNMLGVIEPAKEKRNPKKKSKKIIIKDTFCKDYFLKFHVQKNTSIS